MMLYFRGCTAREKQTDISEATERLLDLAGVDFMDSSGLGLVLGRYRKIKELGGDMFISNASARTAKILKMAGVDKLIKTIECNEPDTSHRKDTI